MNNSHYYYLYLYIHLASNSDFILQIFHIFRGRRKLHLLEYKEMFSAEMNGGKFFLYYSSKWKFTVKLHLKTK